MPDGKPFLIPYQNTPAGMQQDHAATLEANREKAQQQMELEREKQKAAQAQAVEKQREGIQEQIDALETNRRETLFEATTGENAVSPEEAADLHRKWQQTFGPELNRLRSQLGSLETPITGGAAPPQPAPLGQQQVVNPQGTYPQLPPVVTQWDRPTADAIIHTFRDSNIVGRIIGPRPQFAKGRQSQDEMVARWEAQLYRWTLEEGLPFVQDPEAVMALPANTWYIGEDFLKHRVPGRAVGAVLSNAVTDFVGSRIRANLQGLHDAALGLYD
jgi:hypothetical protein